MIMEAGNILDILGAAKQIYDIVDKVQKFKHRSQRLKNRIENMMPAVEKLASSTQQVPTEARTPGGLKLFSQPLGTMLQLMKGIHNFIESLQKKTFANKLLHRDSIGTKFDEYSEQLDCLSGAIDQSLAVEMREVIYENKRRAEDKEDQKEDVKEMISEIEKGNEKILDEITKLKKELQEQIKELIEAQSTHHSSENDQDTISMGHRVVDGLKEIDFTQLSEKEEISTGRFGKTYKAKYMHEMVALKSYSLGADKDVKDVLLKEASNLLLLDSTYIVRLWGVCTKNGPCLLVFEYMARGNLRDVLNDVGASLNELSWKKRIQMALDGALGLYRMHNTRRSLLHQDLASDIFLVDENWKMKISGVGFAETHTTILKRSKPTYTGRSTLNYVCPERLKNISRKPDASTDVYSYGIVMWEIATGAKPYEGYSNEQICEFVLDKKDKLPLPVECADDFKKLIDLCRDFDPMGRPTSSEIVPKLQTMSGCMDEICV